MVDLTTRYLGLDLRSPLVASASPLNGHPDSAKRVEDAGAGALVLPSLFEEEILHQEVELTRALEAGSDVFAEAGDYFPAVDSFEGVGDRYLDRLEAIKAQTAIPVIASLNATAPGSWSRYARWMVDAGADAIELNLYRVAADPDRSGADLERADLEIVAAVRSEIDVPLAVKLSPYYTATAHFARHVVEAGADGLVLFNRFYQPDLDLETFDVAPQLALSQPWELRLPLRWIAILRPQLGAGTSLAATTGIGAGTDAVKAIAVGADVAMMTSALLRHGPEHLSLVEAQLREWLVEHEYTSVSQLRGSTSTATSASPAAFERANYLATLHSWSTPAQGAPAATAP